MLIRPATHAHSFFCKSNDRADYFHLVYQKRNFIFLFFCSLICVPRIHHTVDIELHFFLSLGQARMLAVTRTPHKTRNESNIPGRKQNRIQFRTIKIVNRRKSVSLRSKKWSLLFGVYWGNPLSNYVYLEKWHRWFSLLLKMLRLPPFIARNGPRGANFHLFLHSFARLLLLAAEQKRNAVCEPVPNMLLLLDGR